MYTLWQDLRYAARTLGKAPGFAATAVLLGALGTGATTAMFSLVDAVLVRPLPFPAPERLVLLWESPPGYERNSVSPLNFLDWSEQNRSFSGMAAVTGGRRTLTGAGAEPEQVRGQSVSTSFFDVVGIRPVAGRTFTPSDDVPGARVVVLGEGFWRRRFGGDPTLVGRTITLDEQPVTVIGIVPASFQLLWPSDMWTPFVVTRSPEQRRMHYLRVVGRLAPGVSFDQARDDMGRIAEGIALISPETNKGWSVSLQPMREGIVRTDLRTTSLVLAGVVGFVLLMAAANVANLTLARGLSRRREMAVRAALGGGRGRLVRQLITESLLLAAAGGLAGVALSWLFVHSAAAVLPAGTIPAGIGLRVDWRVLTFAIAVTAANGLLCGVAPAWQATKLSLTDVIGSGTRSSARAGGTLRSALIVAQIATAVLLVSGAVLLGRTLLALESVDAGFRHRDVLTMSFSLSEKRYPTIDRAIAFYQSVEREVSAIPGVVVAASTGKLPLDGWDIGQGFSIVGDPPVDRASEPSANYLMISPRYFEALGIDVLQGRSFTERDTASAPQVCIVNEAFVQRHLKGRAPIGMRISIASMQKDGPTPVVREIVGVIRQVKVEGPGEREPAVQVYVPIAQNAWLWTYLAVRTAGNPASFVPAVKAAVARVDKGQPITEIRTMEDIATGATAAPRFRARLVGAFATVALLIAAVGLFGVITLSVQERRREFGIRMALGATAGSVLGLVVGRGMRLTAAGVLLGIGAAALLTRALATLLYGVTPLDPITFALAPAILAAIALLSCALPAVRAARVSPSVALLQD